MTTPHTKKTRQNWIRDNMGAIEAKGLTVRDIANEVQWHFGLSKPVSPATIHRDLKEVREGDIQPYSDEAMELLKPENFAKFRELFRAPNGGVYQTNETHLALYWVMYALTRKVHLPDWVIEFWELPEDVNDDIVLKEKLLTFIMLLAPRHGKTMTIIHGLIALIAETPDVRILYGQGVLQTSQKAMSLVMSELEHNEKLNHLFGPFRDDNRLWSHRDGFIVSRRETHAITPTFMPIGVNVNVRSLDADIIIIDDPQDLDRAESEATTAKDFRKLTTEIMTRREPHTPVLMVGSHLPTLFGDVFSQIEDSLEDLQTEGQTILMRKRPAHNLDICTGEPHVDCLEWPEYRNWNFLESQRVLLKDEMFEAVYQQQARIPGARPFPPEVVKSPRAEGGILDSEREWKQQAKVCPRCQGRLYTTLGFDPASGEGRKASYSALTVLDGCIQCRTLYLVDYWSKRQSPDRHPETIASFAKAFNVMYVRIEINAYQKALARDPRLLAAAREYKFHVDEWMTDDRKNTPEFGIPLLSRYMREDKFSVPAKTFQDTQYYRDLERALIRYPIRPDDVPMALWLGAGMMWQVWDLYGNSEPIVLDEYRANAPQYMLDRSVKVDLGIVGRE